MKRYDMEICEEYDHDMIEADDGDYVLYSDVAALLEQNRLTKEAFEAAMERYPNDKGLSFLFGAVFSQPPSESEK